MGAPQVVIVEDHALVAETLRRALEQEGVHARVVHPGTDIDADVDAEAVLAELVADGPDLVLLDLDLGPLGDSTGLVEPLTRAGIRVLVVTGSGDRLRIAAALRAGAIGFRSKGDGFDALLEGVRAALSSDRPLDPALRGELLEELLRHHDRRRRDLGPFDALTPREAETLQALCEGRSVAEIARARVVSETTVRSHVKSLLDKLGVHSQLAAVAAAARAGWPASAGR